MSKFPIGSAGLLVVEGTHIGKKSESPLFHSYFLNCNSASQYVKGGNDRAL